MSGHTYLFSSFHSTVCPTCDLETLYTLVGAFRRFGGKRCVNVQGWPNLRVTKASVRVVWYSGHKRRISASELCCKGRMRCWNHRGHIYTDPYKLKADLLGERSSSGQTTRYVKPHFRIIIDVSGLRNCWFIHDFFLQRTIHGVRTYDCIWKDQVKIRGNRFLHIAIPWSAFLISLTFWCPFPFPCNPLSVSKQWIKLYCLPLKWHNFEHNALACVIKWTMRVSNLVDIVPLCIFIQLKHQRHNHSLA